MASRRDSSPLKETSALLLSRVAYGEADLIVQFFTEDLGRISCMAKGARSSKKRYLGALEPMHTLRLCVSERTQSEFTSLHDATLLRPRLVLTTELERMEVAGRALRWIKRSAPARTQEPEVYLALSTFMDELDCSPAKAEPAAQLAAFGMRMLSGLGWELDLTRCIRCGRECPSGSPALLSPERGGLVCRACGGGPLRVSAVLREELVRASRGDSLAVGSESAEQTIRIVERALTAHLGIDSET